MIEYWIKSICVLRNVWNRISPCTDLLPFYDVFISYRWHEDDDEVIDLLYDTFLGSTFGSEKRSFQVFYDMLD